MTTLDHFQTAPAPRDLSAIPSLVVAALLLALLGAPALMAPANPQPTLDWHGNTATTAR